MPGKPLRFQKVPRSQFHTENLRIGYTDYDMYTDPNRVKLSNERTEASKLCSICGKPALRMFCENKQVYGRCREHFAGAKIPRSYVRKY